MKKRLLLTGAVLAGLLAAVLALTYEKTRARARAISPSPDCDMLAFVLERRDGVKQSADLQAFSNVALNANNTLPLTYKIIEVVESPDPSVIAFISKCVGGTRDYYDVYVIDNAPDAAAASNYWGARLPGEPYSPDPYPGAEDRKAVKSGLQFSKDGRYLRFKRRSVGKPTDRWIDKIVRWSASEYERYKTSGDYEYPMPSGVKWVPPKKPAQLPAFMTARQPKIHAETQPAWSPDSKTLYVHDSKGVWSAEINRVIGLPEWRLILPMKKLRAFQISPDGNSALMERGVQRKVEIADLKGKQKPRSVGEGRGARFSPDGKRVAFIHKKGVFMADVQDGKPRGVGGSANGKPNIQRNSRLQWSHDSRLLYIHDAEGVWSMEPDAGKSGWTLIAKARGLHTYRIIHRVNRSMFPPPNKEKRDGLKRYLSFGGNGEDARSLHTGRQGRLRSDTPYKKRSLL